MEWGGIGGGLLLVTDLPLSTKSESKGLHRCTKILFMI